GAGSSAGRGLGLTSAKKKRRRSIGPAVGWSRAAELPVEEALELATSHRMLELAYRLGFDLADAFAGHLEDAAHFFQRVRVAVAQAVPQFNDLALAVRQGFQHLVNLV